MVSRESFDRLEVQIRDRYRFMQWALTSLGVAVTLVLDRGLDLHLKQNEEYAKIVLFFAIPFVIFGIIFVCFYWGKSNEYKEDKNKLFAAENIIKDETVITTDDGATITIDHLAEQGAPDGGGGADDTRKADA